MNILLIANYRPDLQESMQRFADLLNVELSQAGHHVRVVRPEPHLGKIKPGAVGLGKWLGYVDKLLLFPLALRQAIAWADVVHVCDHSNAFYTQYLQTVPHVVTCNDLLAVRSALGEIPQNPTRWSGRQLQQLILKGLNQAQRVVCISHQTRDDLLRLTDLPEEVVSVAYLGLNYPYLPMTPSLARHRLTHLGIDTNSHYLLHVGGNHWYKNRQGVLEIFQALRSHLAETATPSPPPDLYLVFAGAPLPESLRQWAEQAGLRDRIIETPGISNEDLRALYSCATALLFPSLEEGFGWPILEAHACGCPVFTTNQAPMTEVGGSAAFYLDPSDIQGSAAAIAETLPTLKQWIEPSLLNAQRFSNHTMIATYLREYELAIQDFAAADPDTDPDTDLDAEAAIAPPTLPEPTANSADPISPAS